MDEKSLYDRSRLNRKIVKLSWALFFIILGGSWILENGGKITSVQKDVIIYAGSGLILLIMNLVRSIQKLEVSKFTIGLGILGIIIGFGKYTFQNFSIWAVIVFIIGVFMLFEALRK